MKAAMREHRRFALARNDTRNKKKIGPWHWKS